MENEAASAAPAGEAVISPSVESAPQSLGSQTVPREQPQQEAPKAEAKPEPAKSAREAIQRANEQYKAKQEAPKTESKPAVKETATAQPKEAPKAEPAKPEQVRDQQTGKFASPNPTPKAAEAPEQQTRGTSEGSKFEAPARFNQQAKTDWANVPDSVKAETLRAHKELEEGHAKYKASHDRYEQLRSFDETAKSNNRDLKESLQQIVEFENTMKSNPMAAIDFALRHAGPRKSDGSPLTINDIVQHVSGQSTDQRLHTAQTRINELENKIRDMEAAAEAPRIIEEFRSSHDRFDELKTVIVPLLKAGHSLETAYELADALHPVRETPQPLTPAPVEAQAQTLAKPANPAGLKSISGSPSGGSDPSNDSRTQIPLKETPSIKDSLRKAMSKAS